MTDGVRGAGWRIGAALLLAVLACGGDAAGPGDRTGTPRSLAISGGDSQAEAPSTALPIPLQVQVLDSVGRGVPGVTVAWAVTTGGGTVAPSTSLTDSAGHATTIFTLGASLGLHQATATVPGLSGSPARFEESAVETGGPPAGTIALTATVPIPPFYGIHDTYVRDGLALVFAWDSGVRIYDVGNGVRGGSVQNPTLVSTLVTAGSDGAPPSVHNGWWFHNPVTGEARYLFIGQEGPGSIGRSSSGDIHVVDLSDLANPREVALFHLPSPDGTDSAGTHNFWMDESAQILYAAYYNGGVVAINMAGALSGDISSRLISAVRPGGQGNTYVWGVQLANGSLYAIDMLSGLWQLKSSNGQLSVVGGGGNVPERFSSDLWVTGTNAYTGTWGRRSAPGNAVKVWALGPSGAPQLVDSIVRAGIGTVSDIQATADARWLTFTAELGDSAGLYVYSLANPSHPTFAARYLVPAASGGLHTGTVAVLNGRTYVFAARDPSPGGPALMIFDITPVIAAGS